MRTVIIGSGLIGLASAYFLRAQGDEVVVVDRASGPGLETSFANGSILTPSMPEPWNAPGCWKVLRQSLVQPGSPLKLRAGAIPGLASWGVRFLRNSSPARYHRNTLSNLRLALHSLDAMRGLRADTGVEYGRGVEGTLRIFRSAALLEKALVEARVLNERGLQYEALSTKAVIAREPALQPLESDLAGGIHYPEDESGDAQAFCVALAKVLAERGVEFRFNTVVSGFETAGRRIDGVQIDGVHTRGVHTAGLRTGSESIRGDRYVLAAATASRLLLAPLGIDLPVQPAKGYSVTIPFDPGRPPLKIPIVDDELHAVVVPLHGRLRAAGTAEFAGFDRSLPPARVANLVNLVRRVLPAFKFEDATVKPWCGLRPMCADGVPVIGATPYSNLFLNTGHGHLGWTMAAGSGQLLCNLLTGLEPPIDAISYSLSRFHGRAPA